MNTNMKKTFCTNCGSELTGNFCANCGTLANEQTSPQHEIGGHKIHENATVKARYSTFTQILAGGLGFFPVLLGVMIALSMANMLSKKFSFVGLLELVAGMALFFGLFFLACLPGILMIRKRAPEGTVFKTCASFMIKAALCGFAWLLSIVGCCFIVGIVLGAWGLGMATIKCGDSDYTVFEGNEKIAVTRMEDPEFSTFDHPRYIYVDEKGELYRPRLA